MSILAFVGEHNLELKEAEAKKARDKNSATVNDLKMRQAMGVGSIDVVQEESLPGARLPMSTILQWLGHFWKSSFPFFAKRGLIITLTSMAEEVTDNIYRENLELTGPMKLWMQCV